MVDLEWYRIFKIVAEEENITKASGTLNISQPAVTNHIKNLEDVLNVRLFDRSNRGLKLTQEGQAIYEEIQNPIKILENIYNKYNLFKSINLGIHNTMITKLFSKKLGNYYETHENVRVNITNNDILEMIKKLEKEELDIVISKKVSEYNNEKIEFISLGTLQDILVTSKESKIANDEITLEELKNQIIYMPRKTSITCSNFFTSINCKEEDFKNIKNISFLPMLEMIKNANSIGLATKEYIQKELEEGEITEVKTTFKIKPIEYGIYVNKENKSRELNEFIKIIKEN